MSKYLESTAKVAGIDVKILDTVARLESTFGDDVNESSQGARGIMQIMPGTARGIVKNYPDIGVTAEEILTGDKANIKAAAFLLSRELLPRYKSSPDQLKFALADYNSSPNAVKKARKQSEDPNNFDTVYPYLPSETQGYLDKATTLGLFK